MDARQKQLSRNFREIMKAAAQAAQAVQAAVGRARLQHPPHYQVIENFAHDVG